MHPSKHLQGSKGSDLEGKKIILGVTGSIAVVECVKLIRELVRERAEVHCVTTEWAMKLIHPYALEFASGNEVITELTGQTEHVKFCGKVPDKADLFLIAPATANTVSKIANGIDDTPVTTFATTCIGSGIPIVLVPAMHESMYEHPIVMENLEVLKERLGVTVVGPKIEEGAAKIVGRDEIVDTVIRRLNEDLEDMKITVITGRTQEPIDSMRVITNRASGKSGIELAKRAYRKGADVELWYGNVSCEVPEWIPNREFDSLNDLLDMKDELEGIVIVPAALSDFGVDEISEEKISSRDSLTLDLTPMPKLIDEIRDQVDFLIAYKAADTRQEAVEKSKRMKVEDRADMVVANSLKDVSEEKNNVYILGDGTWIDGSKRTIADHILDELEKELK